MGNKAFKELKERPIGNGSMDGNESYCLSEITTKEMTFTVETKGMTGGTSDYVNVETGEVVYKGKTKNITGKKFMIYDKDDNLIAYQTSSVGFKKNKMSIYRPTPLFEGQTASEEKIDKDDDTPLYLAARLVSKDTMTTSEGSVEIVVGEDAEDETGFKFEQIMKAYKISTVGFNAYVEDMNGECLAKCSPKSKMSMTPNFTIAAGTDPIYIFGAVGNSAPGGGGSAGALAGAGVV